VIRDCSDQGAQRLPAIKVGKRGIFVQQSGRKVYELAFAGQELDYADRDLTRLNLDIGLPGFVDIDKSTQPDKTIWLPRGDGQVACLLYDVGDEVEARLQTLGVIENVAVVPSAGIEDIVYFVVRRQINGVTRRFIEKLALRGDCVGGALNKQLDCALVYSGNHTVSVGRRRPDRHRHDRRCRPVRDAGRPEPRQHRRGARRDTRHLHHGRRDRKPCRRGGI
jgi:hypothetical protein